MDQPNAQSDTPDYAWLTAVRAAAAQGKRPREKPFGRWLGDFLDRETESGLLPAELNLLLQCAGSAHKPPPAAPAPEPAALAKTGPAGPPPNTPPDDAPPPDPRESLRADVADNIVRGGFLRFLCLGGDALAPVHEIGIELYDALILTVDSPDRVLDLRAGACVGRVALLHCYLDGGLWIEDAKLGTLALQGSRVAGISGNRANFTGSVFLDQQFFADGDVKLFSAQFGGGLICDGARIGGELTCVSAQLGGSLTCENAWIGGAFTFRNANIKAGLNFTGGAFDGGIWGQGAQIAGSAVFTNMSVREILNMAGAHIGGSANLVGARLGFEPEGKPGRDQVLDLSRATISGDLVFETVDTGKPCQAAGTLNITSAKIGGSASFFGARLAARPAGEMALDARNLRIGGALLFGGGFRADGQVVLEGATVSKTLDFSDSLVTGRAGIAMAGSRLTVEGDLVMRGTTEAPFSADGDVLLYGAACGGLDCSGGTFKQRKDTALGCDMIAVKGCVFLRNSGVQKFSASGLVSFHSAAIAQHFDCGGGTFENPGGVALTGEAAHIGGNMFMNRAVDPGFTPAHRRDLAFSAQGKVSLRSATISQQLVCHFGRFSNQVADTSKPAYAAEALDLAGISVTDTIYLGVEQRPEKGAEPEQLPASIIGGLNLASASTRSFVDDGVVIALPGAAGPAMAEFATSADGKRLLCNVVLDKFTYQRLGGEQACDAAARAVWLRRQPPEHLGTRFLPQPFEQLTAVMRATGYDGDADDIALLKRQSQFAADPWNMPGRPVRQVVHAMSKFLELVLLNWFVGYGYRLERGLLTLLVLAIGFGAFYQNFSAEIGPAGDKPVAAAPHLNPWLYSADVMIPIVGLGEKAAFAPKTDFVFDVQLCETILGWVGGVLLAAFVSGLIEKE